jgi:hypothetical protein
LRLKKINHVPTRNAGTMVAMWSCTGSEASIRGAKSIVGEWKPS